MGAGGLENPPCDRGVGTFAVPTHQHLVGRGQGWRLSPIASGQGFNPSWLHSEASINPKRTGSEGCGVGDTCRRVEGDMLGAWQLREPSPPRPTRRLCLLFPSYTLF